MRFAIAALLCVHGLLHLIGFFEPSKGGRPLAGLWLLTCAVLVGAAALRLLDVKPWWLFAAGGGLVLSQALIFTRWQDARAGTIANAVLLVAVGLGAALAAFEARVQREARELLAKVPAVEAAPVVTAAEVTRLPEPVQRWLHQSGVVGRPRARTVRLTQTGEMRLKPDGAWMPVTAEQYFDVDDASFHWSVKTKLLDAVPVVGRDQLAGGHGHMLITVLGLVPVANARGPKIDQGTLLRFLGEIVWFPSAALQPYVTWEPIDANSARATLERGGTKVSAVFTFDARGRFVKLAAQRYLNGESLEGWEIPSRAWKTFEGIEVPSQGGAVWRLSTGDFDYYRWRITHLEQNVRRTFAEEPAHATAAPEPEHLSSTGPARPMQSDSP